ncbi:hypothetical protein ACFWWC_23775 [Streptomyces sp. NPDC058642]|uniref:hypothetical protein n=1 Tax=Streptomyces sp. NPDC058642 TaxID=3346572 RepID=UPI00365418DA
MVASRGDRSKSWHRTTCTPACTPENKAGLVKDLQERGRRVAAETLAVVVRLSS